MNSTPWQAVYQFHPPKVMRIQMDLQGKAQWLMLSSLQVTPRISIECGVFESVMEAKSGRKFCEIFKSKFIS